jgi:Ni/Co efflux regulator RcnB
MEVIMKKFLLAAAAAAAATIAANPAAAADFGPHDNRGQVSRQVPANHGPGFNRNVNVNRNIAVNRNVSVTHYVQAAPQRRWNRGERFDRRYATNYQVIGSHRGLYAAPRGYQWVRSGNDAVLVSIAGGIVGALIANLF